MGKVEDRQSRILELISKNKKIDVNGLADLLEISPVTVRKDLTALEDQKFIKREKGFAVLNTDSPISARLSVNYDAKKKIIRKASGLVHDGDTVMLESGSSCVLLARELMASKKNVTIITNSVFMTNYAALSGSAHLILCGGDYLPESECLVGPLACKTIDTFHADCFFSGTDGFRTGGGFTGDSLQKAEIIRKMSSRSDRTIVLAEAEKFKNIGTVSLFDPGAVNAVITEKSPDEDTAEALKALKIQII